MPCRFPHDMAILNRPNLISVIEAVLNPIFKGRELLCARFTPGFSAGVEFGHRVYPRVAKDPWFRRDFGIRRHDPL